MTSTDIDIEVTDTEYFQENIKKSKVVIDRKAISDKYVKTSCDLVKGMRCSVETCSLMKCKRVQELTGTVTKDYSNRSSPVVAIPERVNMVFDRMKSKTKR